LDRGHVGAVGRLRVRWTSEALRVNVIEAEGASSVRLECWGGARKRALLERVLERPVEVIGPDGAVVTVEEGDGE
jgi:hypothetical protein